MVLSGYCFYSMGDSLLMFCRRRLSCAAQYAMIQSKQTVLAHMNLFEIGGSVWQGRC